MLKRNNLLKNVLVTGLLIGVISCIIPTSKESYLDKFKTFVDKVEEEHENYSDKEWKWADKQFEKYSEDWYDDYKAELSLEEKLNVNMMILRYKSFKGGDDFTSGLKDLIREDSQEIKEKIDEYLENDAEEDLEKIRKGLEEIGDSAVKVFEDVISALKNKE